jgi:hypothetical protein
LAADDPKEGEHHSEKEERERLTGSRPRVKKEGSANGERKEKKP